MTKGQFVRLFLGSDNTATPDKVISYAKNLTLHVSCTVEQVSTKDTMDDWLIQEVTEIQYDISSSALISSGETISSSVAGQSLTSVEKIYNEGAPVKWQIANVSGDNQRTKGAVIVSGSCILTQLQINSQHKQSVTYDAQLQGYGEYLVST